VGDNGIPRINGAENWKEFEKVKTIETEKSKFCDSQRGFDVNISYSNDSILNKEFSDEITKIINNYMEYTYCLNTDGTNGTIDCSNLTSKIYKDLGITVSTSSYSQANELIALGGTTIYDRSKNQTLDLNLCQFGDLISFGGHVGIYVGEGKFIHSRGSEQSGRGVELRGLNNESKGKDNLKDWNFNWLPDNGEIKTVLVKQNCNSTIQSN